MLDGQDLVLDQALDGGGQCRRLHPMHQKLRFFKGKRRFSWAHGAVDYRSGNGARWRGQELEATGRGRVERMNSLQEEANRLREANRSPLEAFQHGMEQVREMLASGIDFSTADAARQVERLMSQLEGTMQRAEARAPSGLARGSTEALSAINQARLESGRGGESATERLERIMEEQRTVQGRMEQRLAEIRDSLESGEIFGTAGI
ncbi:MAG: hypothetical protein FJ271_28500 [Planctomycetes bacterium]|nr:hypothetical protein [Planctomycetota bacterium]